MEDEVYGGAWPVNRTKREQWRLQRSVCMGITGCGKGCVNNCPRRRSCRPWDEGKNENRGTQPPLPQANNFMRGYHQNSSSNLQRSSKARAWEGGTASKLIFKKNKKNLLSFADEEGADDANALEPKVFISYETAPGHTPRKVAIRRLKAEYLAQNIPATLENAGIA